MNFCKLLRRQLLSGFLMNIDAQSRRYDTQHNNIQHKDTQHNNKKFDTKCKDKHNNKKVILSLKLY